MAIFQKPTPPILQQKHSDKQPSHLNRVQSAMRSQPGDKVSSNQSSICKFAPRHTEEESPYKGRYQHCQTNEELISDQPNAHTPCDLVDSLDHTVEPWHDLNIRAKSKQLSAQDPVS